MTLWGTAHLLLHPDSELLSSALSIECTGGHWDSLSKDSPIISLHLLYFTHFAILYLEWRQKRQAQSFPVLFIYLFIYVFPVSVLSPFSLPQVIFWFGFSFPISCWTRRQLHSLGQEFETEVGGNGKNWPAFIYLFLMNQPKGWGYVYSQTEWCQRKGKNFVIFKIFFYHSQVFLKIFVPL